jgi:hypothetical protein
MKRILHSVSPILFGIVVGNGLVLLFWTNITHTSHIRIGIMNIVCGLICFISHQLNKNH